MENNNSKAVSEGWTKKNWGRGFLFIGIAGALLVIDILVGLTGIDSGKTPFLFYVILPAIYIALGFGILGFWVVIPAFQKWYRTKREWLAWLFLIIAIAGAYAMIRLFPYL